MLRVGYQHKFGGGQGGRGPVTTFQSCPTFEYHRKWFKVVKHLNITEIGKKKLVQSCPTEIGTIQGKPR